jgi:hypothetical protein
LKEVKKLTLDEVIQFIKQALEKVNPDKRVYTEFRFTVGQVKQLLVWLEDYKRLQSESSWIPCSERMPEKDTSVLISAQGHRVSAFYDSVKGVFMLTETEGLFYSMSAVTHWMPLPSPPEVTNNVD